MSKNEKSILEMIFQALVDITKDKKFTKTTKKGDVYTFGKIFKKRK